MRSRSFFAKELGDLTKFLPGPAAVKGVVVARRAGGSAEKLTLKDAVNGADRTVARQASRKMTIHLLSRGRSTSPSKRQLETGAGEAWVSGWAATDRH